MAFSSILFTLYCSVKFRSMTPRCAVHCRRRMCGSSLHPSEADFRSIETQPTQHFVLSLSLTHFQILKLKNTMRCDDVKSRM